MFTYKILVKWGLGRNRFELIFSVGDVIHNFEWALKNILTVEIQKVCEATKIS